MSLSVVNQDSHKDWLNPRVNNLVVDGDLTYKNASGFEQSGTFDSYFIDSGLNNSPTVTFHWVKVDDCITIHFGNEISGWTPSGVNNTFTTNDAVPAAIIPDITPFNCGTYLIKLDSPPVNHVFSIGLDASNKITITPQDLASFPSLLVSFNGCSFSYQHAFTT